ncbi:MAG: hypothetical protein ACOX79_02845 [Methanosarcina sp.]
MRVVIYTDLKAVPVIVVFEYGVTKIMMNIFSEKQHTYKNNVIIVFDILSNIYHITPK